MGLIISSLSDCLTAESWECWANGNTQPLTTRGLFDQRSSGVCWLLQRINITTRGSREPSSRVITRNQERRRQSWSAQCTGRVLASLKADETLQVCWVCNHGLQGQECLFSPPPPSPLYSPVVSPGAGYTGGSALTLVRTHKSHKIDSVTLLSSPLRWARLGTCLSSVSIFEEVHRTP